jgi:hypothetical protein
MTVRTSGGNMEIPNDLFRTCLHYAESVREFRELTDRGERLAAQLEAASAEILRLMIAADRHAIRVPTIPETILVRTEDDDLEVLHPASAFEVERLAEEAQTRPQPDDDAIAEAAFNGAFHDVFGGALLDGEVE